MASADPGKVWATIGDAYRIWDIVNKSADNQYESGKVVSCSVSIGSNRCLKWQKDKRFLEEEYHVMIWDKLKDIMLPFGYIFDGHSTNLLTR